MDCSICGECKPVAAYGGWVCSVALQQAAVLSRLAKVPPDWRISLADQDALGISRRDFETVGQALSRSQRF